MLSLVSKKAIFSAGTVQKIVRVPEPQLIFPSPNVRAVLSDSVTAELRTIALWLDTEFTVIDIDNNDIEFTPVQQHLSDKLNLVINSHRLIIDRMDTFLENQKRIMEKLDANDSK